MGAILTGDQTMKTLHDGHYRMNDEGTIWIDVRGFSIQILTTGDGILIDIFDAKELDQKIHSEPVASAYAFDHELESAHE
jgi:hypothetical protein